SECLHFTVFRRVNQQDFDALLLAKPEQLLHLADAAFFHLEADPLRIHGFHTLKILRPCGVTRPEAQEVILTRAPSKKSHDSQYPAKTKVLGSVPVERDEPDLPDVRIDMRKCFVDRRLSYVGNILSRIVDPAVRDLKAEEVEIVDEQR